MPEKRSGNTKYITTSRWVNEETGEIRIMDEFEKDVGRTERFMITYLAEILLLFDVLGNKKMQVINYILKNMCKSDNMLVITTEELAKKAKVSRQTVSDSLKILTDANIINRKTGAIMISPRLMNNKRVAGEASMLIKFSQFDK